ncbi:hypothetical protein FRC03_006840 [Tulasnella sp. 419]|nr:hypothetical protein FRC02_009369 [Tulasnella sp. 418]KAG8960264.1 hypothetical protein FRC03_006840 [Tulasnella sp. 419]
MAITLGQARLPAPDQKNKFWYAVQRGYVIGVFPEWNLARPQVECFQGSCHKRFRNWDEAWLFAYAPNGFNNVNSNGNLPASDGKDEIVGRMSSLAISTVPDTFRAHGFSSQPPPTYAPSSLEVWALMYLSTIARTEKVIQGIEDTFMRLNGDLDLFQNALEHTGLSKDEIGFLLMMIKLDRDGVVLPH